MKCVILAGGKGTRLAEETLVRPKPMVEIGGRPILWHIMKTYAHYGVKEFIICLGYKGYMIKEYFANYFLHNADVVVDVAKGTVDYVDQRSDPWRIYLIDTGEDTQTGGRLKRVARFLTPGEPFYFTNGDGLSDIDIAAETEFHRKNRLLATVATVHPPARFGNVVTEGIKVARFEEKPQADQGRINGGFFILQPEVTDLIAGDEMSWERFPMEELSRTGQLAAFQHNGFWQPMDTLREKLLLESLWDTGRAPWKKWA
jgi:glucose-1-phosphate cytidylyltransferase